MAPAGRRSDDLKANDRLGSAVEDVARLLVLVASDERALGPLIRELTEVSYQFEHPFVLDSTATQTTFVLAPTPWEDVLVRVIASYREKA